MAKLKRNSLTKEIIFLVLSGFTAAFILFLILFQVGTTLLSEYFAGSNFIYNSETSYINELTEFVHKKKLAATDTDQLGDWAHQKGIRHFTISRERVLIYDSTYSNSSFTFVQTLIKCIISSFYMCFVIDYPHNPIRS